MVQGKESFQILAVFCVMLWPHHLGTDNRHVAPKHTKKLRQQFHSRMSQELSKGEIARIINAVQERWCRFVVSSAESQAFESLTIHATDMSNCEDWPSTLPFDADIGDSCKDRKDGKQN